MNDYLAALDRLHPNPIVLSPETMIKTAILRAAQTRNEAFRHHDAIVSRNGDYPLTHATGFNAIQPGCTVTNRLLHDARLDSTFYNALMTPPDLKWGGLQRHFVAHWTDAEEWERTGYLIVARNFITTVYATVKQLKGTAPSPFRLQALDTYTAAVAAMATHINTPSTAHLVYRYLPHLSIILALLLLELEDRGGRGKATFERLFSHFLMAPTQTPTHYNLNIQPRSEAFKNTDGFTLPQDKVLRIGLKLGETKLTVPRRLPHLSVPEEFVVFLEEPFYTTVYFASSCLRARRTAAKTSQSKHHGTIVSILPVTRVGAPSP